MRSGWRRRLTVWLSSRGGTGKTNSIIAHFWQITPLREGRSGCLLESVSASPKYYLWIIAVSSEIQWRVTSMIRIHTIP